MAAPNTNPTESTKHGITLTGTVSQCFKAKNGKTNVLKVTVGDTVFTVFSKHDGVKQGDPYSAILNGLNVDEYRRLSGNEMERF